MFLVFIGLMSALRSFCLSLLVTEEASSTPAEKNLYHQEYYNSNHDAGTVVRGAKIQKKVQYQAGKQEHIASYLQLSSNTRHMWKSDFYLEKLMFLGPGEKS